MKTTATKEATKRAVHPGFIDRCKAAIVSLEAEDARLERLGSSFHANVRVDVRRRIRALNAYLSGGVRDVDRVGGGVMAADAYAEHQELADAANVKADELGLGGVDTEEVRALSREAARHYEAAGKISERSSLRTAGRHYRKAERARTVAGGASAGRSGSRSGRRSARRR